MTVEKGELPFEEFPRFHTVSFGVEPNPIEISNNSTNSTGDEREYLFPKMGKGRQRLHSRPRMSSVFHMVDSKFAGGIVTRANYMARCYRTAWEINAADIECLRLLLWSGESSQSPSWQAFTALLVQWLMPFLPLVLIPQPVRNSGAFRAVAWIFFLVSLGLLAWHLYALATVIRNRKCWKRAWFTFEVPSGTIGLVDSGESHELTLFHFSANIRFVKTTFSTIFRLHTISQHEQEILEEDMRRRSLDTCEIILYTEDFLNCYSLWPKYMTSGLAFLQLLSFLFVTILLAFG